MRRRRRREIERKRSNRPDVALVERYGNPIKRKGIDEWRENEQKKKDTKEKDNETGTTNRVGSCRRRRRRRRRRDRERSVCAFFPFFDISWSAGGVGSVRLLSFH